MQGREADAKALEEALKKMGEELKKSEMTKPAGEALENKNLSDAEKAMHDLAKKLREQGKGVDKAQLEKMREALKKAGEDQAKRAEALEQQARGAEAGSPEAEAEDGRRGRERAGKEPPPEEGARARAPRSRGASSSRRRSASSIVSTASSRRPPRT